MAVISKDSVSAVNDVISVCKDAEQGFKGAANAVENPVYKTLFNEYAAQRAAFATELQTAVRGMGAEPSEPSGAAGTVHAGWMALKGVLTGHSEHQILEETERGEDLSVRTYRDAIAKDLPFDLRQIIETQYAQVMQAHNRIRSLRDATDRK